MSSTESDYEEDVSSPLAVKIVPPRRVRRRVRKVRPEDKTQGFSEDPLCVMFSWIAAKLWHGMLTMWAYCRRSQCNARDVIHISVAEFGRCLIFACVLVLGCKAGLNVPARIDGVFQNVTRDPGFGPDRSTFRFHFVKISRFSDRFFLFGQFVRRELPNATLELFPPGLAHFRCRAVDSRGKEDVMDLGVVDLGTPFGVNPPVVMLYRKSAAPSETTTFVVEVEGNVGSFDTFSLTQFSNNPKFAMAMLVYRVAIALWFLGVYVDRDNHTPLQNVIARIIFFTFVPTWVLLWLTRFSLGILFILDALLGNLFTLFMYDFWLFLYSGATCRFSKHALVLANIPLIICVGFDSIYRSYQEFAHPLEWLTGPVNIFDSSIVAVHTALLVLAYLLFARRPRRPDDLKIDLGTFAFFSALMCGIMDETAIRMRTLACMAMWKPLRFVGEIIAVWLLTYERTHNEPSKDELLLSENGYEYEYDDDGDDDDDA
jgi:hypothetical protein